MATSPTNAPAARVALITGGAGDIGLGCARLLAAEGVRCALVDLEPAKARAAAATLGAGHLGYGADVTDEPSMQAAVAAATTELGPVNVMIAAAGITGTTVPAWQIDLKEVRRVIDISLLGTFIACRAVIPGMIAQKWGRIVVIASIAGKEGNPNLAAYSAAKGGAIALTKSLGKELATTGVLVNAIAPAVIETAMNRTVAPETLGYMTAKIPMGRLGRVDEVAELVGFLSSHRVGFSTGAVYDCSGGRATY
ncbi:MAG TPA: SDR family NAD(P)-dependent oxidoreductase [Planctomycetota bacterium]|nr:SDR family NAD(P)-dependent oxidoreductase [Planctomycetota bacterium]